jgi:UTP:GlnB (protein PII) uridylyltransferase
MHLSPSRRRRPVRHLPLSREHRAAVDEGRAVASRLVAAGSATAYRIATAPPGFVLAQTASDVARQCELLEPLPALREVRTALTPGRGPGTWHLDLATRDRPGLLAAFTGVLLGAGVDVAQAVVATWPDGAALQALVIRGVRSPDAAALQAECIASLARPLTSVPFDDVEITFDQDRSPLYTACEVSAPDHPGLLHAVAVALSATGIDIHAASVTTVAGVARDRFDLTDRAGSKVDPVRQRRVRDAVRRGIGADLAG